MKRHLFNITLAMLAAILLVACGRNATADQQIMPADTAGFAQFQAWKAMVAQQAATPAPAPKPQVIYVKEQGSMSASSTHTAKTKKGWSKAAKYSAIGAGGGAVLGAVINKKNRVAGAVIGGVLGGGLGYGIGRSQDKKDGRY